MFSVGFRHINNIKDEGTIRIMTWNVSCADSMATADYEGLIDLILKQDADVIFITEYFRTERPELDSILNEKYAYRGTLENWVTYSDFYSRIPIDSCVHIGEGEHGCLLRHDLNTIYGKLSLYCVHLQSNNMLNGNPFYPDSIQDKSGIIKYLKNYNAASIIRNDQAKLIVSDFSESPCIVMGDMNDVDESACMRVFAEAGMTDAWWGNGLGYGATIHHPLPYRIDHILTSKNITIKGIKKINAHELSDHDALVVDVKLK